MPLAPPDFRTIASIKKRQSSSRVQKIKLEASVADSHMGRRLATPNATLTFADDEACKRRAGEIWITEVEAENIY